MLLNSLEVIGNGPSEYIEKQFEGKSSVFLVPEAG